MPVDPQTGNRLPYKGEPGYDEAKKKFPDLYAAEEGMEDAPEMPGDEGPDDMAENVGDEAMPEMPEGGVVPSRDLKPLMDEADKIIGEDDEGEDKPEDKPEDMEEAPKDAPSDIAPLMEMLGMSEERAQEILDASKTIPKYAEMSSEDLAELISEDFQVLMELEKAAAEKAKPQDPGMMDQSPMSAGMTPPMGGPAGEPPM